MFDWKRKETLDNGGTGNRNVKEERSELCFLLRKEKVKGQRSRFDTS